MTLQEWFQLHRSRSRTGSIIRERWFKKPRNVKALKDAQGKPTNIEEDDKTGIVGGKATAIQTVHTPVSLRNEMWNVLFRSQEEPMPRGSKILVLNAEFLDNIYSYGIMDQLDVTLVTDNRAKIAYVKQTWPTVKIEETYLPDWNTDMKFKYIVGNPPYQNKNVKRKGGSKGNTIWDKFVEKATELLDNNGYLCFVHPSRWRFPGNKSWKTITAYQVTSLACYTVNDGLKTFGANIGYDIYCLRKCSPKNPTNIRTTDGQHTTVDISLWPWIPNSNLDIVGKLLAKHDEAKLDVIYTCVHHTQHDAKPEATSTHEIACVNTIMDGDTPEIRYSAVPLLKKEQTPKIILHRSSGARFMLDLNGSLGMTENAFALTSDSPSELKLMFSAVTTKKFKLVWEALKWSNYYVTPEPFRYFKKDFWKEFVDSDGNEIP